MEAQVPSPQTTLLILLGASAWPFSSHEFQSSQAFANAARGIRAYFLNPRLFGLPVENVLDLFDSNKSADELDVEIEQFLERRLAALKQVGQPARDVLLCFIGHGGFVGHDSDFYLAIRHTRMDNPRVSGLEVTALAYTLMERTRFLRRIIILDCCFAAAAFSAFEGGPDQVAIEKTVDAFQVGYKAVGFPTKGTTLLCSSSHKSPSLLLPDGSSTMFTKAFLDALVQGASSPHDHLTLHDVRDLVADLLSETRNAPRPVVLSPDQSEGDVADIPFFPNPRAQEERARQAEEERRHQAEKSVSPTPLTSPEPHRESVKQGISRPAVIIGSATLVLILLSLLSYFLIKPIAAPSSPYPPSGWKLLFEDSMKTNVHSWLANNDCRFTNDAYQITVPKSGLFYRCPLQGSDYSNFALEVKMTIVEGDYGGIIFHGNSHDNNFYYFAVHPTGYYDLYLYLNNQFSKALAHGVSSAIVPGLHQRNLIAVVAEGNTFHLYANKQLLITATDNTLGSGSVSLGAGNSGSLSAEVIFSNVEVWGPPPS